MKFKAMFGVYIILCPLFLGACALKSPLVSRGEVSVARTQIAELEMELEVCNILLREGISLTVEISDNVQASTPTPTTKNPTNTSTPIPNRNFYEEISLGQTIIIPEQAEFTIQRAYFAKKIVPPNPDRFYTYYEAQEPGTTYLDLVVIFKNLHTTSVDANEFGYVKLLYDNKYEYNAFPTIEESNGGDFGYASITPINPLQLGTIHYLIEVPIDVETSGASLRIQLNIFGNSYIFVMR